MLFRSVIYVCHVWVELRKFMQVRLFMSGAETVLTDAANPEELFATADFETRCGDCLNSTHPAISGSHGLDEI